jgi:chromosome segregation ATPase
MRPREQHCNVFMSSICGWANDMRIRRIEIENFKKLIGPVVIDNIGEGITVIAGDNEEGKSTVLQALRTILFDRHNLMGDAAEAMQPFGHRVRPEIALDFEIDDKLYRLVKGFCQRPSAELKTPNGSFAGMAVEEKLQELLRFRPPGRGQGRPDLHHGVCGLFWVEQGQAFSPISLSDDNRGALMGALEGEVGQVLGGKRGRALKEAIATRYTEFFTNTGRPRGALAEASATVDKMQDQIASLKQQLSQYDNKVDELSRTRERLAAYGREGRLARAQSAFEQSQAQKTFIEKLERGVRDAANEKALAEAGVQGPAAMLKRREDAIARRERDAEGLARASEALIAAETSLAEKSATFAADTAELQSTDAMLESSEAKLRIIERRAERARLTQNQSRLARAFAEARTAEGIARDARAAAAAIKVDNSVLKRLRTLDQKFIEAEAALAGSSTLIRFQLTNTGVVTVGGSPAPTELSITQPTELEIAGSGVLTVIPGGEELSARRAKVEAARSQLHEALQKAGAPSLAQAETLVYQRQQHLADAETQAGIVSAHAPEGIDKLESELASVQAVLVGLSEEDAAVGDDDLNSAQEAHREALKSAKQVRKRWNESQTELDNAKQKHARAQATREAAEKAATESDGELARARASTPDDSLRETLTNAGSRAALSTSAFDAAEAALKVADPEASQLIFEKARDGLAAIEADIKTLDSTAETIALELKVLGQQGLGEEVQDVEGCLALAISKRDRLDREARTLKLLYETLCRAEQHAREAFLTPVQTRVQPYLRLLLPETELVLSDTDLGVTHLRRNGQDEPFESLSVGAREQIAVLTRLAFADLLREQGVTAPVVLDDALVNSDPRRLERMQLAIRRAAKHLQVIVLTCDESDWVQAGVPVVRLAACRAT